MPIPYLPWIKIYGSGFFYDYRKFENKYGWKTRIDAKLTKATSVELYITDDNKGSAEIGGKLSVNIALDSLSDVKNMLKISDQYIPQKRPCSIDSDPGRTQ